MTTRRRKTLETPTGKGRVLDGEQPITEVLYRLKIDQEIHVILRDGEEIPGLQRMTGWFRVLEGQSEMEIGKNLKLVLEDGREWEFIAKSFDIPSREYSAVNAGGMSSKTH